jgi:hypothetical protein
MSLRRLIPSRPRTALLAAVIAAAGAATVARPQADPGARPFDGKTVFRFDTFGDEQLWTDTLRMHEVIASSVSPVAALGVGLKVDSSVLPPDFLSTHDLTDPATTVELIRLNAVVGVVGHVTGSASGRRKLKSVGITCALCHSTVDDSVIPGIGNRRDGWANTDLNPGAIIALSPAIPDEQKVIYNSWGPGRFDPRFNVDGINFPVVIPPAYGLQGVGFETFTGDGPISYWNNYVAVMEMGGHGSFSDPRLGINVVQIPDRVRPRLPALLQYQLSLAKPSPPPGSYDPQAAERGRLVFNGPANCASCHVPPTYTDVLTGPDPSQPRLHAPAETGMEPLYASRSATGLYRTTPLRALFQHAPYFHDGSAPTLEAVVTHYDGFFGLGLTDQQKADLVQFLKSL